MFRRRLRRQSRSKVNTPRARLWLHSLESRTVPTNFTVTSNVDSGTGTLRNILGSVADGDSIDFDPSIHLIALTGAEIAITKSVTITGPGAANLTITPSAGARVFNINTAAKTVSVSGMTLSGSVATVDGAALAITAADTVTLDGMTVRNNSTNGNGGGLTITGAANVTLQNNTAFTNNSAGLAGGAIHMGSGVSITLTINNSALTNNTTTGNGNGGALNSLSSTTLNTSGATFSGNRAGGAGGALNFNINTSVTAINSTFSNNFAASTIGGGAIRTTSTTLPATLSFTTCTLSGNTANAGPGGAIVFASGSSSTLSFTTSTLSSNSAAINGGAFSATSGSGSVVVTNSTVSGNIAGGTGNGGGISATGTLTVKNSTIANNTCVGGKGGGIFINSTTSTVTLSSTILATNINATNSDLAVSATRTNSALNLGGNNLFGALDTSLFTMTSPGQFGSEASPLSPGLYGLNVYAGPNAVATQPLTYNSKALNAGVDTNTPVLTTDQRGLSRAGDGSIDVGAVEGTLPNPFAASATLPAVVNGASTYSFSVVYDDDVGIDTTTVTNGAVSVIGQSSTFAPTVTGSITGTSGHQVTVTYTFAPPGGTWDAADGGAYTISVVANKVKDSDGSPNFAPPQVVGVLNVSIVGTLKVDDASDAFDGKTTPGFLSLREAVAISNNSVNGYDTITFAHAIAGQTLTLGGKELAVTDPVAIQPEQAGDKLTINANFASRIFNFSSIPNAAAASSLSGLTLKNGGTTTGGGAITMGASKLNLSNDTLTGNTSPATGGAILGSASATLTVTDCLLIGNSAVGSGAAIAVSGLSTSITIIRSTVSGNAAGTNGVGGGSGAIYANNGIVSIDKSTISGNNNLGTGSGGGFAGSTPTVTITNSTFSGNATQTGGSATGGAIRMSGGSISVFNSTIAGNTAVNGGGIAVTNATTSVTINSTIIAQNTAAASADTTDLFNSATATLTVFGDANLIGVVPLANIDVSGQTNSQIGSSTAPLDAKLAPLANYGGPTFTMGLFPGSPAVDKGNNLNTLGTDQRDTGFPRELPMGSPDVGAFEGTLKVPVASATLVNVTTTGTTYVAKVTYTDDVGVDATTLDVNDVKLSGPGFATAANPATVNVTGSGGSVTVTYTFNAPGGVWTVSANGTYTLTQVANQVYDIDAPTHNPAQPGTIGTFKVGLPQTFVVDNNLTDLDDGKYGPGELTLREAVKLANTTNIGFTDIITFGSSANFVGASIVLGGSELVITDPLTINGLGAGNLTINANNKSRVFNINITGQSVPPVAINCLTLTGGNSNGAGGAIAVQVNAIVTLSNDVITASTAIGLGGGIYAGSSNSLSIIDTTIANNFAISSATQNGAGGGIGANFSGQINVIRSTLSGNTTSGDGGAIAGNNLALTNVTLSGNVAGGVGGAISMGANQTIAVNNCTITRNSANGAGGGGIAVGKNVTLNLQSSIVAQNVHDLTPDFYTSAGFDTLNGENNLYGVLPGVGFSIMGAVYQGGAADAPLDARLSALASNGGPTLTHALTFFSPAIDVGNNVAGLSTDQRGLPRESPTGMPDIGAVEGVTNVPYAFTALAAVPPANAEYVATVNYEDGTGINTTSIDTSDVRITTPGGAILIPSKVVIIGSGQTVSADYYFTPPGGSWDGLDNGRYTLSLVGTVLDTDTTPHAVPTGPLGTFNVSIDSTYVVDTLADVTDNGDYSAGNLSLRKAIALSNRSFGGVETITFAPGLFATGAQTITLALGELLISNDVKIQGPGADKLTISANNTGRSFRLSNVSRLIAVDFSGAAVANGNVSDSGAGFSVGDESLTLDAVWLHNNTATVNGGGVALGDRGRLNLLNSTVSGNVAATVSAFSGTYGGGGVYLTTTGTLIVRNTTLSGNTAVVGFGGAVAMETYNAGGSLLFENCTITGNSASVRGGGISVFPFNSVGIVLASTIVAGNQSANVNNNQPDLYGYQIIATDSLIGALNATSVSGAQNLTNTMTGTPASPLDAKLAPLANNGGPTLIHALLSGSPAIDAGSNPSFLTTDQRGAGYNREVGMADIGAYERQGTPVKVTNVVINNGAAQRSRVKVVTVNFDAPVAFVGGVANAFRLIRQSDSAFVTLAATPNGANTAVTLTFLAGSAVEGQIGNYSIADGRYTLTVLAANIGGAGLDGNGDGSAAGSPADNYVLASAPTGTPTNIFRRFGDYSGDGYDDSGDFLQFRLAFLSQPFVDAFDFDGDGVVNGTDFLQFRLRFLQTLS